MLSVCGWRITQDHQHTTETDPYTWVGIGQYWIRSTKKAKMIKTEQLLIKDPMPFQLYDDDGILYMDGVISRSWLSGSEDLAFAPLHWAAFDSGCTELRYFDFSNQTWKKL